MTVCICIFHSSPVSIYLLFTSISNQSLCPYQFHTHLPCPIFQSVTKRRGVYGISVHRHMTHAADASSEVIPFSTLSSTVATRYPALSATASPGSTYTCASYFFHMTDTFFKSFNVVIFTGYMMSTMKLTHFISFMRNPNFSSTTLKVSRQVV